MSEGPSVKLCQELAKKHGMVSALLVYCFTRLYCGEWDRAQQSASESFEASEQVFSLAPAVIPHPLYRS